MSGSWSNDPITLQSHSLHICNICRRYSDSEETRSTLRRMGQMINRWLVQSIGVALLVRLSSYIDRLGERSTERQTAGQMALSVSWLLRFHLPFTTLISPALL